MKKKTFTINRDCSEITNNLLFYSFLNLCPFSASLLLLLFTEYKNGINGKRKCSQATNIFLIAPELQNPSG